MLYFAPGSNMSLKEAYFYGAGVIAMSALYTFTHHPYFFGVMHTGMRIRIATCCLVYRKVNRNLKTFLTEKGRYWVFILLNSIKLAEVTSSSSSPNFPRCWCPQHSHWSSPSTEGSWIGFLVVITFNVITSNTNSFTYGRAIREITC